MKGINEKIVMISAGIVTGIINGVFGGGGGMVIVPMLIFLLGLENKNAHATAILIILPISIASGICYCAFGSFKFALGLPVTLGVIFGGVIGAVLLKKISSRWIAIIFSILMFAAGLKLLIF